MNNILILSAGRRVELIQAFRTDVKSRGLCSSILAADLKPELSAACQVADMAIKAPRVTDRSYVDFLLDRCKRERIAIVVPTIDTELLILACNREVFQAEGISLVISDESLVRICRDKRLTAKLFRELGISTPTIFDRGSLTFPCFAKPYDGSRSIGAALLPGVDSLTEAILGDKKMMFMEFIDGTHTEFTVDAYYDRFGRLRCFVPRQRIEVRSGEISKGITRKHFVYDYLLSKLTLLMGAKGCVTLQLFVREKDERFAALEINPRFGGGFPLSYSAGAKYPGWLIDEYILDKEIPFYDTWEPDILMLRYDAKVLTHGVK